MKKSSFILGFLFILAVTFVQCTNKGTIKIKSLKVEMQKNPMGVSNKTPRFSWQIITDQNNLEQTSYQVEIAKDEANLKQEKNLIWNSGKVKSNQSVWIDYKGEPLKQGTSYFWRVKICTNQGKTDWSDIGHWSMSIDDSEWKAKWIGENAMSNPKETDEGNTRLAARYLRKTFNAEKSIKRAMLYISGLGLYKAFLNGKSVSDDILSPTVSWYPVRVYYNTYEVTDLLETGKNTIGVELGNGRFFGLRPGKTLMFGLPRLLAQLEIEYTDGTMTKIISDKDWKITSEGPIISNNEYDGEEYDARKEITGWDTNSYNDSSWKIVDIMESPKGKLTSQPNPNIAIQDTITPIKVFPISGGKYIIDMGQNMVGWLKIKLNGEKNHPITIRFAESLKKDNTLYMDNLREAKVTDIYTPAKDGIFTWRPVFTYHGFRYAEVSGLNSQPELNNFTGEVFYDKMETTGQFESSNKMLNTIYKNAYWGIRGNYRGMPTDCPQRDERQGWLGDRATGSSGEAFIFDNNLLYKKWMQDIEDSQSPEGSISDVSPRYWTIWNDDVTWPSAYFLPIQMLYRQYGDILPIKKHYVSMKKYMEHIQKVSMKDYILEKDTYGDWCMPPESLNLIHSKDPARKTDGAILSTTTYYKLLNLMTEYAKISGNDQDTIEYINLAQKIKEAYNKKFFNADSAMYGNNTVTANILSLRLGLVPKGYEKKVFDNIIKKTETDFQGHVSTGVLGIQQLMRGLTQYGEVDEAYKIATNDTYPSWGYMVKNGATTIWELWNGNTADPAMNSRNHVMLLGDLIIWFYEDLAGIKCNIEGAGFKKIIMQPYFPKGLTHIKASYKSIYGLIKSEWTKADEEFTWNIAIPANTSAVVRLPSEIKNLNNSSIREVENYQEFDIGSGNYTIKGSF
ncbi:MAG: family 78 glycoside hydrolase catalytic domain [Prolixibacteraceae bacterium]|nr:family 78 glycoside hydrolase catalytic domain [Prolixibacteraceae bacterium]